MKTRLLSFVARALFLGLVITAAGTRVQAAACPANYCVTGYQTCKAGCPCATFYCDPVSCWSDCSCPIICLD